MSIPKPIHLKPGRLTISDISGGIPPYQYSINCGADFQADSNFTDLPAGNYCLIIEDANGCLSEAIDTALIVCPTITFEFELVNESLACYGNTDAEIHFANVMGGSGPYSYSIDGGNNYQPDTFFLELGGGNYQLVVQDDNLCPSMPVDTSIVEPDLLVIDTVVSQDITSDEDGFIKVLCFGWYRTISLYL